MEKNKFFCFGMFLVFFPLYIFSMPVGLGLRYSCIGNLRVQTRPCLLIGYGAFLESLTRGLRLL